MNHKNIGDPEFLRKNAWKVLQLRRYHLAASFFSLSGGTEEAARVLAGHLGDMQLALVFMRRRPDIMRPLLLDRLNDSPLAAQDPCLRLLLAWRAGDKEAARAAVTRPEAVHQESGEDAGREAPPTVLLFDSTLRPSALREDNLQQLAAKLLGPSTVAAKAAPADAFEFSWP